MKGSKNTPGAIALWIYCLLRQARALTSQATREGLTKRLLGHRVGRARPALGGTDRSLRVSNESVVRIPRAGLIGAIAVVLASGVLCQTPEAPDARECGHAAARLSAASDRERAWGAYLAAVCHMPDLPTAIAAQLQHTRLDMFERTIDISGRTIWGESQWAGYAMLDALIQLRQPLQASALASIAPLFPAEATILMLQDAERNLPQLAAVREVPMPYVARLAASNALARLRAPGFAATLLRELPLLNSVFVLDPGKSPHGSPGSGILGISETQVPPGFPPVAL